MNKIEINKNNVQIDLFLFSENNGTLIHTDVHILTEK